MDTMMRKKRKPQRKVRIKMIDTRRATSHMATEIKKRLPALRKRGINPSRDEFAVVKHFARGQYISFIWENLSDGRSCSINIGDGTSPAPSYQNYKNVQLKSKPDKILDILP